MPGGGLKGVGKIAGQTVRVHNDRVGYAML